MAFSALTKPTPLFFQSQAPFKPFAESAGEDVEVRIFEESALVANTDFTNPGHLLKPNTPACCICATIPVTMGAAKLVPVDSAPFE